MRSRVLLVSAMLAGVTFFLPALSQTSIATDLQAPIRLAGGVGFSRANAPYTAELKTTRVQTLQDGTTITTESTNTRARDAKGRTVDARTFTQPYSGHVTTNWHVDDRVAGTRIDWNSEKKEATLVKMPPTGSKGCWRSGLGRTTINYGPIDPQTSPREVAADAQDTPPAELQPKTKSEDLGKATVQGIEAHGHRYTTTTPVGAIGNDQPLIRTEERWNSTALGLAVKTLRDDPQTGKETIEMVNLKVGDPDPSVFLPPEGYEIKTDEMVPCNSN